MMNLETYRQDLSEGMLLRLHENKSRQLILDNGVLVEKETDASTGVNISYRNGHHVSSFSRPGINPDTVKKVIEKAERFRTPGTYDMLPPLEAFTGEYITERRPVSPAEKVQFLRSIDSYLLAKNPNLMRTIVLGELFVDRSIADAQTVSFHSKYVRWSFTLSVMAEDSTGGVVSCDALMSGEGNCGSLIDLPKKLYERIDSLLESLEKKKYGKKAAPGETTCILGPDPACMLVHEAVGHTCEGDMVLSGSAAVRNLGKQVASEMVTLGDYALTAAGERVPQPVYIDDEGVRTRDAVLIQNGVLSGFMHDRDSAHLCGVAPTGNARAFEFHNTPLIRMRNTCILPGSSTLEEMITSVDDGLYLVQAGMGQADTTGEFMIAIIEGYRIEHGKLGDAILDTVCSGVAFDMMKTIDMVGNQIGWDVGGLCGKGQPMVTAAGSPALRCRLKIGG